jgi:PTH1 family peptidyl-tRNA hydrolase
MKIIVGLGNPGSQYAKTRHNVGYLVLEELKKVSFLSNALLLKPETFMNESGKDVLKAVSFYKISLDDLLVIHDDMDLPLGKVKLQKNRSSAGHNGVQSIINSLDNKTFFRLRVGVSRPEKSVAAENYVLQNFSDEERPVLDKAIKEAVERAVTWANE